jgi:putative aldouronate transport system substrate-binding protein
MLTKGKLVQYLAVCVAITLITTAVSGCNVSKATYTNGNEVSGIPSKSESNKKKYEKTIQISRLYRMAVETFPAETTPIEKEIEQKFNVKLKRIYAPTANYDERLSSMVASGDLPDVFLIMGKNQMARFAKEGVIGDLKGIINEEQYPLTFKRINDPIYKRYIAYEGGIYGLPNINTNTPAPWVPMIRKDWLKELNLKMPESLKDLYNVAKAFKSSKGIYPIGACYGFDYDNLNFIMGAYGVIVGSWYLDGGKAESYDISPKMKEALGYLRKLKEEGLLDPDWSTQKEEPMFDKLINGKTGIIQTWSVYHWRKEWSIAKAEMIKAGKLSSEGKFDETTFYGKEDTTYLDYMPMLKGLDGKVHGLRGQSPVFDRLSFSKKAVSDAEKISRIMDLAEWSITDDGWTLTKRGHNDIHYTFNTDGYLVRMPGIDEQTTARVAGMEWWSFGPTLNEKLDPPGDVDKPYEMKIRKYSKTLPLLDRAEDYLVSQTLSRKMLLIDDRRKEYFYKIVNGILPIDAFDKWVEEYKAMGYEKIQEEMTKSVH